MYLSICIYTQSWHHTEYSNGRFSAVVCDRMLKLRVMVYWYTTVTSFVWSTEVLSIMPKNEPFLNICKYWQCHFTLINSSIFLANFFQVTHTFFFFKNISKYWVSFYIIQFINFLANFFQVTYIIFFLYLQILSVIFHNSVHQFFDKFLSSNLHNFFFQKFFFITHSSKFY